MINFILFFRQQSRNSCLLCVVLSMFSAQSLLAQERLTLNIALDRAISRDAGIERYRHQANAALDLGLFTAQLPDPTLKLGARNLPVDTFSLDQEPMTQLSVGLSQQFPAGESRAIASEIQSLKSDGLIARAELRRLEVINATRQAWFDTLYWHQVVDILNTDRTLFNQILYITESLYSLGKKQQQDVLRADLEISRLQERTIQAHNQLRAANALVERWVGEPINSEQISRKVERLPPLNLDPNDPNRVAQILAKHPLFQLLDRQIEQSTGAVKLAEQSYKPSWGVDAAYGFRDGDNLDGSDRTDFFSVIVNVQLPVFTGKRQDKKVSSMRYEREAEQARYLDTLRQQTNKVIAGYIRWQQLSERLALYESSLIKQSQEQAQATLNAYQSGASDFAELMQAYLSDQSTQLDYQKLIVDQQKTLSQLHFLYSTDDRQDRAVDYDADIEVQR